MTRSDVICKQRIVVFFETAPESWLGLKVYRNLRSKTPFTPRNFCLKLAHAPCLYSESSTTQLPVIAGELCAWFTQYTTQVVVSRLHATVLGKRCVVQIRIQVTELRFPLR